MAITWTTLRPRVRSITGDAANGVYTDASIDDAARDAYQAVMVHNPLPAVVTANVIAGQATIPLSNPVRSIIGITPAYGSIEPGTAADLEYPRHYGARLMYVLRDATTIELSRNVHAAEAGTWYIRTRQIPPIPSGLTTPWGIPEELETALLKEAAAALLRQRLMIEQRRGHALSSWAYKHPDQLHKEAMALARAYGRQARQG